MPTFWVWVAVPKRREGSLVYEIDPRLLDEIRRRQVRAKLGARDRERRMFTPTDFDGNGESSGLIGGSGADDLGWTTRSPFEDLPTAGPSASRGTADPGQAARRPLETLPTAAPRVRPSRSDLAAADGLLALLALAQPGLDGDDGSSEARQPPLQLTPQAKANIRRHALKAQKLRNQLASEVTEADRQAVERVTGGDFSDPADLHGLAEFTEPRHWIFDLLAGIPVWLGSSPYTGKTPTLGIGIRADVQGDTSPGGGSFTR